MLRFSALALKWQRRCRIATLLAIFGIAALPSACERDRLNVGDHSRGGTEASGGKLGVAGKGGATSEGIAGAGGNPVEARGGSDVGGESGGWPGNGGAAPGDGGTANAAGASGAPGTQTLRPAPDYCADLNFEFDGQKCESDAECAAATCNCSVGDGASAQYCDDERGCLVDFDCDVYCRRGHDQFFKPEVLNCVVHPCQKDSDCYRWAFSTVCVRREDAEIGFCRAWDRGACVDEDDCLPEQVCEPSLTDGTRTCVDPDELGCKSDADCDGVACALQPGHLRGTCTTGTNFRECDELNDCRSGLSCVAQVNPRTYSLCTDGEAKSPCERDDDCLEGRCLQRPNEERLCSTGQLFHTCEKDGDCLSGLCVSGLCSSGDLRSWCEDRADCKGGANCVRAQCSDGSLQTSCEQNSDCQSNHCAIGRCFDGLPGSHCDEDVDCASAACAKMDSEDQELWHCE